MARAYVATQRAAHGIRRDVRLAQANDLQKTLQTVTRALRKWRPADRE